MHQSRPWFFTSQLWP